ncbi:uncharacterized protein LOC143469751 [Clavelina lepadiformis]|uniref:uncharacterized protein LOC143469751 n=1 Tax=Clavelina lepadiformis TaxID=159417 RepID=UPI00404381B5
MEPIRDANGQSHHGGACMSFIKRQTWTKTERFSLYVHISLFAMFGCLIRLGVDFMMGKDAAGLENFSSVIFVSFFANMFGCFCLGMLTASPLTKGGRYTVLHTGISTGLCGSITTYSRWNQHVSLLFLTKASASSTPQVVAIVSMVVGLATTAASLTFGNDVMKMLTKRFAARGRRSIETVSMSQEHNCDVALECESIERVARTKPIKSTLPLTLTLVMLMCTLCAFVAAFIGASNKTAFAVMLSILFAPFGAGLRFALSPINQRHKLPLGTLLVNALGSTLVALTHVLQMWGQLNCAGQGVATAFSSGFAACLTTVSTFMSEVNAKRKKGDAKGAYWYVLLTFFICQILGLTINGTSNVFLSHTYKNDTFVSQDSC